MPACSSQARPRPATSGLGSSVARCTARTPASTIAPAQGGVRPQCEQGSRETYIVAPLARSPGGAQGHRLGVGLAVGQRCALPDHLAVANQHGPDRRVGARPALDRPGQPQGPGHVRRGHAGRVRRERGRERGRERERERGRERGRGRGRHSRVGRKRSGQGANVTPTSRRWPPRTTPRSRPRRAAVPLHQLAQVVHRADGLAAEGDEDVAGLQPGRLRRALRLDAGHQRPVGSPRGAAPGPWLGSRPTRRSPARGAGCPPRRASAPGSAPPSSTGRRSRSRRSPADRRSARWRC